MGFPRRGEPYVRPLAFRMDHRRRLADGFAPDNHVLPACGDLAGLERVLHFANGWVIEHAFDSQRLRWRLADGSASGESDYRASSLRENLYLVDFLKQENGRPVSVSLVLDFDNQAFTAVLGHLPDRAACEQGLSPGPWPAGN